LCVVHAPLSERSAKEPLAEHPRPHGCVGHPRWSAPHGNVPVHPSGADDGWKAGRAAPGRVDAGDTRPKFFTVSMNRTTNSHVTGANDPMLNPADSTRSV
jgi:hypothetical protein